MKKASIKTAILIPVLAILVVGVIIMVVAVGVAVSSSTANLTTRLIDARVNEYTNEFRVMSRDSYATVRSLAPVIDNLAMTSDNPREEIVDALESVLRTDDQAIGIWTCWEPNALDGKDSDFVSANEYHDGTGRFIPYVVKNSGGITREPLAGYDDPAAGDYYQGARSTGKPYITDPFEYPIGGETLTVYSITIPIIRDGAVVGAVGIDINVQDVIEAVNAGSILDVGYLFVVSPGGLITTHRDPSMILSDYSATWLGAYSTEIDNMLANGGSLDGTAYSDVTGEDMQFLSSSVMIGDTGKYWAIFGVAPVATVNSATNTLLWILSAISAALILVVGAAILLLVRRSLRDLPVMTDMAGKIAVGDIRFDNMNSDASPTKNEITLLERSFVLIADSIKDQTAALAQIAEGDYTLTMPVRSEADVMNRSINTMIDRTNTAMGEIQSATEQVASGSKQIADGAQSLAQGSTEQAATVQQLSASTTEIAEKTRANAEMAEKAASLANTIKNNAEKGSRQMDEMMSAVNEITQASHSIGKVIKVIDDIAFQTNILALNAAVEAARAGQHGKGFAVVAEEVRNLAAKSAEAAKDTGGLIQNSIEKAELGAKIAKDTAASLVEIVAGIDDSTQIVTEIAASSEEQAGGIVEINSGIDQVAQVVQQNSATAEESAAASEELSGQSAMLQQLIAQFKLKKTAAGTIGAQYIPAYHTVPAETGMALGGAEKY